MPGNNCERPPNAAQPSPQQGNPRMRPARLIHSSGGSKAVIRAAAITAAVRRPAPRPPATHDSRHPCHATRRLGIAERHRLFRRLRRFGIDHETLASRRRLRHSMQRIVCPERDDWHATAERAGFNFHTIDGERYWDEQGLLLYARPDRTADRRGRPVRSMPCASNWSAG